MRVSRRRSSRADALRDHRRPRRLVLRIALLFALGAIGLIAWAALGLLTTRADLEHARGPLRDAQAAVAHGDYGELDRSLSTASSRSADASRNVRSLPLRFAADIPWVGDPVRSVRGIADVVDTVARNALPPAAAAATALTEQPLLADGRVDLESVGGAAAPLEKAQSSLDDALVSATAIDTHTWIPQVNLAASRLLTEIDRLRSTVSTAHTATSLAPGMLGADGRRTYLIVLQNNAESRGTGGLVGAFVTFVADRGRILDKRVVKDVAVPRGTPIDLGADYEKLYGVGDPTQIWQNSNLSPHFPYAARIWQSLARQLTGVKADVVIGIDPVGLSSILRATGPIPLSDGRSVTSDNLVETTESTAYSRFADSRSSRKSYLAEVADSTFDRIVAGRFDLTALGAAFANATNSDHLAMWSQRPDEQVRIAATRAGHEVPYTPAPYAAVVVNNSYASKLDYYLDRKIEYRYGNCFGGRQRIRVDVTLTNTVDTVDLSPEVLGTYLPGGDRLPPGSNRLTVSLYSSWGSRLTGLTVNGSPVGFGTGRELGHPVNYALVVLPPRTPVTVQFELSEALSTTAPQIPIQPLTRQASLRYHGARCSP